MNFIELCKKAVALDSTPRFGNKDVAEFYASVARDLGFQVDSFEEMHQGTPQNLLCVSLPKCSLEKHFLMFSQLDTPSPGDYVRWTKNGGNPFSAVYSNDALYGLGVARAKIDFLVKLMALKELQKNTFTKMCPVLIGSFGEESGSGALRLIRRKNFKPEAALVGVPTDMKIGIKGPGYANLEVFVPFSEEEKNYHKELEFAENITTQTRMFSAKPKLGSFVEHEESPIGQMLEYLKNLPEGMILLSMSGGDRPSQRADSAWLELQIYDGFKETIISKLLALKDTLHRFTGELRSLKDPSFFPEYSTINVGAVRTRPDGIVFLCSCRFVAAVSKEQNLKWLNDFEKECEQKGAHFQLLEYREPFYLGSDSELLSLANNIRNQLNMPNESGAIQWCSDANVLNRFGIDTLVIGAGKVSPGDASGNESILMENILMLQDFYKNLTLKVCQ